MLAPALRRSRPNLRHAILRSAVLLGLHGALAAPTAATPFLVSAVDTLGDRGQHSSLALDALGDPRILYTAGENLYYAARRDTTWTVEPVDLSGSIGLFASLALDPSDVAHASYFTGIGRDLMYARRVGGYWLSERVDTLGHVGLYSDIAVSPDGQPWISYYDFTNGNLKIATRVGGVWTVEEPDTAGDVGFYTSLALDSQGRPHVAYGDLTQRNLKHARRDAGGWFTEEVDIFGSVGDYCSLALDSLDRPRISYTDVSTHDLKYAEWNAGAWTTERVDESGTVGYYTSLAIGPGGEPRIAYIDLTVVKLRFAARQGLYWSFETIDPGILVHYYTSLALDSEGNPRVSYYDWLRGDLKYADSSVQLLKPKGGERWPSGTTQEVTWVGIGPVDIEATQDDGATWTLLRAGVSDSVATVTAPAWTTTNAKLRIVRASPRSTSATPSPLGIAPGLATPWTLYFVDRPNDTGNGASLCLQRTVNPHYRPSESPRISYWDASSRVLRYAAKSDGTWRAETVASPSAGVQGRTSLAINPYGVPMIAYVSGGVLQFASRVGAGPWSTEPIPPFGGADRYCSLALDAFGAPRIAYRHTAQGLVLAAQFGPSWSSEVVDAATGVGEYPSLVLDAAGWPRITYSDPAGGRLRYASKAGGVWTFETIESGGYVGAYSSLALDSNEDPHVAYYDAAHGELHYAVRQGGGWVIETVDAPGDVGAHSSIALLPNGSPVISYYDATGGQLKVATRTSGRWTSEAVDATSNVGVWSSIAVDLSGAPRVAYYDRVGADLKYASGGLEIISPARGAVWPVGATRTITWEGRGRVDVSLVTVTDTTDATMPLASGLTGNSFTLTVPRVESTGCLIRIERAIPYSVGLSESLFTIRSAVALLAFEAGQAPFDAGSVVTWATDPGPADLKGYRLERSDGAAWTILEDSTKEISYRDPSAVPGRRYRLTAINGLGDALLLGETPYTAARPLAAGPLPWSRGALTITFATVAGAGGGPGASEVRLYDVRGRLVRTIASGPRPGGMHSLEWNGLDDRGRPVASGIYFLKLETGGKSTTLKLAVAR